MTILGVSQRLLGPSIPVLCYHQVRPESAMSPEKFGRHLDALRSMGFETISLARLYRIISGHAEIHTPSVVITFDDCTLDNWIHAVPALRARGMHGVFFAMTDFLVPGSVRPRADQTHHPVVVPSTPDIMTNAVNGDFTFLMNQQELQLLVQDLGMEVYSHSAAHQACFIRHQPVGVLEDCRHWSHQGLCGVAAPASTPVHPVGSAYAHPGFGQDWSGQELELETPEQRLRFCLDDFTSSRIRLEAILDRPCPFLCLPWGHYDNVTLEAARAAGFSGVLNLDPGYVGPGSDAMRIGRIAVKDRKTLPWLGLKALLLAHKPLAALARPGRRRKQP